MLENTTETLKKHSENLDGPGSELSVKREDKKNGTCPVVIIEGEEAKELPSAERENLIEVHDGNFSWDYAGKTLTLKDISIKIPEGMFV